MSISCSGSITAIEGDRILCACKEEVGNPPSNLTWYKNGKKFGVTTKKENRLVRNELKRDGSGTFKCVAQSEKLADEKSFQLSVLCKC